MAMNLHGKNFTVTGAASGIGRATAILLAELGAAGVAISDVNEVGLKETEEICLKFGTKITARKLDVSDADAVSSWIADTVSEFGKLDGAANVAGIAGGDGTTTVQTIVQRDWDRMMGVNLNGVMYCMRSQLEHIAKPGGSIVNVASTAGIHGLPKSAAYSASKHGVIGLTRSAAGEFGRAGVRINSVLPGPIDTRIFREGEEKGLFDAKVMGGATQLGRMGRAEEVANVIAFLLSDSSSYVTGARWTVDGGYTA
ncbi:putative short chain dehydrogenase/ reductase [Lepidopterella palustris CBS 459.81]|uniref:Putative short chain dehydrogenase/ reductase n=1 Tax=Lepidopterella palustris CBS 459.81 TaxID=1314670 RepID=A0A8E2ECD0_9PEZI|nr:putative short chain dehydrogenase/ reductase [Lepidopterella palustris CBS 459.81]